MAGFGGHAHSGSLPALPGSKVAAGGLEAPETAGRIWACHLHACLPARTERCPLRPAPRRWWFCLGPPAVMLLARGPHGTPGVGGPGVCTLEPEFCSLHRATLLFSPSPSSPSKELAALSPAPQATEINVFVRSQREYVENTVIAGNRARGNYAHALLAGDLGFLRGSARHPPEHSVFSGPHQKCFLKKSPLKRVC